MELSLSEYASPLGGLLIVSDEYAALVALEFADHEPRMRRVLERRFGAQPVHARRAPRATFEALRRYFDGDLQGIDTVPVRMAGTAFQQRCWQGLRAIAPGTTASYAQLALTIGAPGAARAVGRANAVNPIAIVLPCHRVIGADAALTGYAGGVERKAWLLAHEAVHAKRAAGVQKAA